MRAAELMVNEAIAKYEAGGNPGEEANLAKLLSADASWAAAGLCSNPWRIWLCRGIRYRTQVSRGQTVSSRTDLDQSDFVLHS